MMATSDTHATDAKASRYRMLARCGELVRRDQIGGDPTCRKCKRAKKD